MTNEGNLNPTSDWQSRLRQLLHWATGDRAAEGKALADQAGPEVSEHDATIAVRRAHGDLGVPPSVSEDGSGAGDSGDVVSDVATPADAQNEHDEPSSG